MSVINTDAYCNIKTGSLCLEIKESSAYLNGKKIPLTAKEFSILFKLLSEPQKIFSREQLMDSASNSGVRTVDVYITNLRNKLSECHDFEIITVHGTGYKSIIY